MEVANKRDNLWRNEKVIELCYAVSDKASGEEVLRSCGKFESMDDFYSNVNFRYGYTSLEYHFILSDREITR